MERFWEKVDVRGADDCWEWKAGRHNGYGVFWHGGRNHRANRMALIVSGTHPSCDTDMALHSCDNPPCCNPNHLRWGSAKENTQDFIDRHGARIGDASTNATITSEVAANIMRARIGGLPAGMIAAEFGVKKSLVENILRGYTWTHLLGVDGNPTAEELKAARSTVKREAANRIITDAMVDDILQSRMNGESTATIAKRLGLPEGTVSPVFCGIHLTHRLGVDGNPTFEQLRAQSAPNPLYKLTEDDIMEIKALLDRGAVGARLAEHYGVSRATISNIKKGKR